MRGEEIVPSEKFLRGVMVVISTTHTLFLFKLSYTCARRQGEANGPLASVPLRANSLLLHVI